MFLADVMAHTRKKDLAIIIPIVGLLMVSTSTVFENDYYSKSHFGVIEELAEANQEWGSNYGDVTAALNVSSKSYMDFYAIHHGYNSKYELYTIEPGTEKSWDRLYEIVSSSESDYFSYGWSTRSNHMVTYEIIRSKYPEIVDDRVFDNSRVTLFRKNSDYVRQAISTITIDFKDDDGFLAGNHDLIVTDSLGSTYVKLSPSDMFGTEIKFPMSALGLSEGQYIAFEFTFISGNAEPGKFVFELERDGRQLEGSWNGRSLSAYNSVPGQWNKGVFAREFDPNWKGSDVAKIFLWNEHGADIILDEVIIKTYEIVE